MYPSIFRQDRHLLHGLLLASRLGACMICALTQRTTLTLQQVSDNSMGQFLEGGSNSLQNCKFLPTGHPHPYAHSICSSCKVSLSLHSLCSAQVQDLHHSTQSAHGRSTSTVATSSSTPCLCVRFSINTLNHHQFAADEERYWLP